MSKPETPNVPGQPITTRQKGAYFYCLACGKEYRQCKCKVYVSADTLRGGKSTMFRHSKQHLNGQ